MINVHIIGGNLLYTQMFERFKSLSLVENIREAHIVVFTGGEDVSPDLYGQHKHPSTGSNPLRDDREIEIFNYAMKNKKFMIGICRGAQFLHVMCGGQLYQNVEGHTRPHLIANYIDGPNEIVTSTHHQMMKLNQKDSTCTLLAEAIDEDYEAVMVDAEYMSNCDNQVKVLTEKARSIESLYHHGEFCFCFQPHPEFPNADPTFQVFRVLFNYCWSKYLNSLRSIRITSLKDS